MTNAALDANPPNADYHLTTHGSDWLWAVFAVMLFSDLIMMGWTWMIPKGRRTFHHLTVFILTTASIAYFAMASDLGATPVSVEFGGSGSRQIWYARYIDWTITTPLLLLELLLGTGLPLSDIVATVFFDLAMIETGLIGSLIASSYKWGFFAFGCGSLFYIWFVLCGPALRSSGSLGPAYRKTYMGSAIYLSFIWMLYPICWGLADGANVISSDSEMIFYGILDLLAKPVFCFFHVFMLSRVDYTAFQLQSGKFSDSAAIGNHAPLRAAVGEKNARADATGVTGGAANPRPSTATATTAV